MQVLRCGARVQHHAQMRSVIRVAHVKPSASLQDRLSGGVVVIWRFPKHGEWEPTVAVEKDPWLPTRGTCHVTGYSLNIRKMYAETRSPVCRTTPGGQDA